MRSKLRCAGWAFGRRLTLLSVVLAALLLVGLVEIGPAQDAPAYRVLYTFTGAAGFNPGVALARDKAGNLYGTSPGGTFNCGVVFKLDPFGHDTAFYSFTCGTDGSAPGASVTLDAVGNVYGTASRGGGTSCNSGQGCGTVFKLDPSGAETTLYTFQGGTDGECPLAALIRDPKGNLYGTTLSGGDPSCNCGTVFKLDTSNAETVLYAFKGGTDGMFPEAALTMDAAGNLYGTTAEGGNTSCSPGQGCGTVFKLDTTSHETVLYAFAGGADGTNPQGAVLMDAAGNLYGTTTVGGDASCNAPTGCGTVFKLDTTGKKTILRTFTGGLDGAVPFGSIVRDMAGNIYGTTVGSGAFDFGVVYKLTASGKETVLHAFTGGADGGQPFGGVIADKASNLYGVAEAGGLYGGGVAFKLSLK